MTGRLDAEQLGKWQKKDLQSLAEQLGVDSTGTIKDLAERCASVEVGAPDESERTADELIEAARAEAADIVEQAKVEAEQIRASANANEPKKETCVECLVRYYDLELDRTVELGEQWDTTAKRAHMLKAKGYVDIVKPE